jgi:hypothetical protein
MYHHYQALWQTDSQRRGGIGQIQALGQAQQQVGELGAFSLMAKGFICRNDKRQRMYSG